MSKPFDYSKWDNIELSDDEDDVHPNIDRESWFRLKHRSRVEREEREEIDKKRIKEEMAAADRRIAEISRILNKQSKAGDDSDSDSDDLEDTEGLEAERSELRKANQARQDKLEEYEKNKKWNVDNMCHVVEERTIVNKKVDPKFNKETGYALGDDDDEDDANTSTARAGSSEKKDGKEEKAPAAKESASVPTAKIDKLNVGGDEAGASQTNKEKAAAGPTKKQTTSAAVVKKADSSSTSSTAKPAGPDRAKIAMMSYHEFTEKYADVCEEFCAIRDLERSKQFLIQNGHILLQENASNYLLLATLEDEMNGLHDEMRLRARQSQIVSNIAELAKTLSTHPGNVILPFFKRIEEKEHMNGFLDGVETFIKNIQKRAVTKRKEIDAEREREAKEALQRGEGVDLADVPREERLGPGGLDPVEVFESLPTSMQEAFESREVDKLKEALLQMPPEEAERHMQRCVACGLWNES